jgi:hypothetical protein
MSIQARGDGWWKATTGGLVTALLGTLITAAPAYAAEAAAGGCDVANIS